MKLSFRRTDDINSRHSQYNHCYIQVLADRYSERKRGGYNNSLEVVGTFSWQQTRGEDRWYAFNAEVRSSKPEHFTYIAKVMQHAKDNSYSSIIQPDEFIGLFDAEEYFMYAEASAFLPKKVIGQNFYKVYTPTSDYYTWVVAPNEVVASKILSKDWKNLPDAKLRNPIKIVA